jgi:hypothetical protein
VVVQHAADLRQQLAVLQVRRRRTAAVSGDERRDALLEHGASTSP